MAKFMLDGREYCGSGSGVSTVKLTQAEYDALSDEKLSNNVIYIITDSDELSAKNVPYDGSVTGLGNNVQSAIDELNSNLGGFTPVIDDTGKITGYKTSVGGADTVFPFSNGLKDLIWVKDNSNTDGGGVKTFNLGGKPSLLFLLGWNYAEEPIPIYQYSNGELNVLWDKHSRASSIEVSITDTGFSFKQTMSSAVLRLIYGYKI